MRLNWFVSPRRGKSTKMLQRLIRWGALIGGYSPVRWLVQVVSLAGFFTLFLYVCFPYTVSPPQSGDTITSRQLEQDTWPAHYAEDFLRKEVLPAELFLAIDPLVSISTAIASQTWIWSLTFAGITLLVCLFVPRGFCGYVCPLGTVIDLFDQAVGNRVRRPVVVGEGWYVHLRYYVLVAILISSAFGVLASGFLAAIPIVTRAATYILTPLETGLVRSRHQVPAMNFGHFLSLALFAAVLGLGFLRRRFWCCYVCPSGAVFSIANVLRLTQRKVKSSCVQCGKCVDVCPFDAINADFSTRTGECTFCQTCGGACPVTAIQFVPRWTKLDSPNTNSSPPGGTPVARREFLTSSLGLAAGSVGGVAVAEGIKSTRACPDDQSREFPVRPPGSVPEQLFLRMCIRCGECLQACPNDVLQPQGFDQGMEELWTPRVAANWSGCEPSCNNCCQVCPTGAIRAIPLKEKRVARMGRARVNKETCLPYAGRQGCQLCVDECAASGYNAIEFMTVGTQTDEQGYPIERTGRLAPVVLSEKCVGCGLCQTRCYAMNVKSRELLDKSAIVVEAGPGKEDRITSGSYIALREAETRKREAARANKLKTKPTEGNYLPDFLK